MIRKREDFLISLVILGFILILGLSACTQSSDVVSSTENNSVEEAAPRQELSASDPAEFSLASGQYQLVEFFAFW